MVILFHGIMVLVHYIIQLILQQDFIMKYWQETSIHMLKQMLIFGVVYLL